MTLKIYFDGTRPFVEQMFLFLISKQGFIVGLNDGHSFLCEIVGHSYGEYDIFCLTIWLFCLPLLLVSTKKSHPIRGSGICWWLKWWRSRIVLLYVDYVSEEDSLKLIVARAVDHALLSSMVTESLKRLRPTRVSDQRCRENAVGATYETSLFW